MRSGVPVVVLGACSFQPGTLAAISDATSDATSDVRADATAPPCAPADPTLRACFAFDGDSLDGSSYGNNAVASGATFVPGRNDQAIATAASTITVGATSSLDLSTMTLAMWIRANSLPLSGQRYGLLDSSGRYRMFVQPGGAIRCTTSSGPDLTTVTGVVPIGTWVRITCTYDVVNLRIYVGGTEIASQSSSSPIPATGSGLVIGQNDPSGENFDGAIDDLQIWNAIKPP